jgi:hypothetical protein
MTNSAWDDNMMTDPLRELLQEARTLMDLHDNLHTDPIYDCALCKLIERIDAELAQTYTPAQMAANFRAAMNTARRALAENAGQIKAQALREAADHVDDHSAMTLRKLASSHERGGK